MLFVKSTKVNKSNKILSVIDSHIINYPTPINLNYAWSFGSMAGFCFVIQLITGIFLAMYYNPNVDHAFASVEYIMTNVTGGWLIRYVHANMASFFFFIVYLHLFRGLYHASYVQPRRLVWMSGIVIFFLMMATAFIGYVLPWGQMSFWGATVITNLFSAIPSVGSSIVEWLWGGFSVDNPTLNRFYSFHYLLPFLIAGVVLGHIALLHDSGSGNPLGIQQNTDVIKFHGPFFVKDLFSAYTLTVIFFLFLTFLPNILGHPDNYSPANPLVTPTHIVPEWYFLPFYAILRSVPDKLGGVVMMVSAILVLALLPFDAPPIARVRRNIFRRLYFVAFSLFVANFFLLGWFGQLPIASPYTSLSAFSVLFYFGYFLVIVPVLELIETWYDLKHSKKDE